MKVISRFLPSANEKLRQQTASLSSVPNYPVREDLLESATVEFGEFKTFVLFKRPAYVPFAGEKQ